LPTKEKVLCQGAVAMGEGEGWEVAAEACNRLGWHGLLHACWASPVAGGGSKWWAQGQQPGQHEW